MVISSLQWQEMSSATWRKEACKDGGPLSTNENFMIEGETGQSATVNP